MAAEAARVDTMPPYSGTSTCACGQVQFALEGDPVLAPRCSCNDCRTAVMYVDAKARAAGTRNISSFEAGNDQCAAHCVFPLKGVTLVRGADKMRKFRLRSTLTAVRTYTACCNTTLAVACGPSLLLSMGVGAPFNFNTLEPPPPTHDTSVFFRAQGSEAPAPSQLPHDAIPNYSSVPLSFGPRLMYLSVFGSRFHDAAAREVLAERCGAKDVTEVAGRAAYEAAGYKGVC